MAEERMSLRNSLKMGTDSRMSTANRDLSSLQSLNETLKTAYLEACDQGDK